MHETIFATYLDRWRLIPDGAPFTTPAARLLPVRRGGEALMLKVVTREEAKRGNELLAWWDGRGAARVLEMDADALLMERALGAQSLIDFAAHGRDDEATAILCDAIAALHAPRAEPPPELTPLDVWFTPLLHAAHVASGPLQRAAEVARRLLAAPRDVVALHGDIHHGNVLDFGARGWLAIDPHALIGERGFDYANIFTNPDLGDPTSSVARDRAHFRSRVEIVSARSGVERSRLIEWVIAWCGLSAIWLIEDGMSAEIDLAVAELAIGEAGR